MATRPKKDENPDWGEIVKWGIDRIMAYWTGGEEKSQDFRVTKAVVSFLKGLYNEQKKQTKLLEEIRDAVVKK